MSSPLKIQNLIKKLQRLLRQKKAKECILLINRQKQIIKEHFDLRRFKAIAYLHLKKYPLAKTLLETLNIELENQHEILRNLAICCKFTLDFEAAIEYSNKVTKLSSATYKDYILLASVYELDKDQLSAIVTLKQAGLLFPNNESILIELSQLLIKSGNCTEAIEHLQEVTQSNHALLLRLDANVRLNHYQRAVELIPEILSTLDNDNVQISIFFIGLLNKLGKFKIAQEVLMKIPPNNDSLYFQALIESGLLGKSELEKFEINIQDASLADESRKNLMFALSEQFLTLNLKKKGFAYLHDANKLVSLTTEYKKIIDSTFENIESTFSKNISLEYSGNRSKKPIFIIGMPRSGTTLLENILSSHSQVFGAGETPFIRKAINGKFESIIDHSANVEFLKSLKDWDNNKFSKVADYYITSISKYSDSEPRIVDKMPHNFLYLGMIKTLFPEAKIIHIRRNPIACCFSLYKQNLKGFHSYASDLEYLAIYYNKYKKLMDFWNHKIDRTNYIEVDYEDVVNDIDKFTHNILDFCDLPFEENCLNFHQSKRAVSTASIKQVRSKLYNTSLKPWIGIEDQIKPLLDAFPEYLN